MSRIHRGSRFWIHSAIALTSGVAGALATIWPDWIERSTGLSPDGGHGSTEWGWALALVLAALSSSSLAWRSWVRR